MPLYEYRCPACGERFELLRSASERDDEAQCPRCGKKKKMFRLQANVQALFGGGGKSTGCSSGPLGGG
ncbi:MAG: zinc ribbon domain-containing protein [Myxococcales bacterium]|nr:zinc ribbon domain-containing protein [Myxococcales bacterium]